MIILLAVALIYQNLGNVEGRTYFHKQKKKGSPVEAPSSQEAVSPSPVEAPSSQEAVSPSPVYPPLVPSDPSGPGDNSSSGCVFDVTSYGAVGDGSTDDTPAFRTAWKAACAVESAVLLVPSGYVFTITSTIFSGPWCSNVEIDGVTCGPSHGISIGSLGVHNSQACVSNITVRNAMIRDSNNGLRIKTWQGGAGSVSGITFDTIEMDNIRNCIIIDQFYCLTKACRKETSAVYLSGVSYNNIKRTYDVQSPPIHFACSDTVPCTNITMSEVELLPFEGELVDDPFCWNSYGFVCSGFLGVNLRSIPLGFVSLNV
ncbi:hypothetical protein RHMOL_Rhmol02G0145600 [Rhododendron molle]|uniref:Uncharacterized protein n=1 Tax=Rhododendron molle TaxID=49168 RepID=A0ACC0PST3_RHOML|nr:hypothetical protein RHMOL_Rhmol02G0145600 [Rhododendron molle]